MHLCVCGVVCSFLVGCSCVLDEEEKNSQPAQVPLVKPPLLHISCSCYLRSLVQSARPQCRCLEEFTTDAKIIRLIRPRIVFLQWWWCGCCSMVVVCSRFQKFPGGDTLRPLTLWALWKKEGTWEGFLVDSILHTLLTVSLLC